MLHKSGSTLIEMMIYLTLFSLLIALIVPYVIHSHIQLIKWDNKLQKMVDHFCMSDVLMHDLRSAPSEKKQWKYISDTMLIWHMQDEDIGWLVKDSKLIRVQGKYSQALDRWTKRQSNVVLHNVHKLLFTLHKSSTYIQNVSYRIVLSDQKTLKRTIYLNNRMLI